MSKARFSKYLYRNCSALVDLYQEARNIYVGPGWALINNYERCGRVLCGSLYMVLLLGVLLFPP